MTCWQIGCGDKQEVREGAKFFDLRHWESRVAINRWDVEGLVGKTKNLIWGMLCVRRLPVDSGMLPLREGFWATEARSQSLASSSPASSHNTQPQSQWNFRCLKAPSLCQLQGLCICCALCLDHYSLDNCYFPLVPYSKFGPPIKFSSYPEIFLHSFTVFKCIFL